MFKKFLIIALALSMPLMKTIDFGSKKINLATSDFFLVLILIHLFILFLLHREKLAFPQNGFLYLFIIITLISTLFSMIFLMNPQSSLSSLIEIIKFSTAIIYYFIFYFYINTRAELNLFFKSWIVIAIFELFLGLYGLITQNPDFALYFRIQGSLGNPNLFAMFMNASVFISLYLYIEYHKKYYILIFLLFIFGVFFSASRAATVSLIIALSFFFLYKNKFKYRLSVVLTGFALIAILISTFIIFSFFDYKITQNDLSSSVKRVSNLSDINSEENFGERLDLWKMGLEMITNYPLLGVGKGNYEYAAKNLVSHEGIIFSRSHNTYIGIAGELGIPGLILFICMLLQIIITLRYSVLMKNILAKIILSILIAFLAQAILMNIENVRFFWGLLAIGSKIKKY